MFMENAKVFFRLIHSLCVYCSLRRTHTARYLLLLNQVRDPLTHIYIHIYMCVCTCVCNKYMKFRRGISFRFISKRYTCSCICVSVSVSAACACNSVCVSTVCHSVGARHQKSKMAAQFANTKR